MHLARFLHGQIPNGVSFDKFPIRKSKSEYFLIQSISHVRLYIIPWLYNFVHNTLFVK